MNRPCIIESRQSVLSIRVGRAVLAFLLISLLLSCSSTVRFSSTNHKEKSKSNPVQDENMPRTSGQTAYSSLWQAATAWLGVPYLYGGTDHGGIDCSALTGHIYRQVYKIDLPRTVALMVKGGRAVSPSRLQEGDLLFFKNTLTGPVDHVGIYLGEGRFIHASLSQGVIISDTNSGLYRRRLITVRRYIP